MVVSGLSLGLLLCLAAPTSHAQRRGDLVARGEKLVDDLRFEEALEVLSAALLRAGQDQVRRARVYELLGYTYLALGRNPRPRRPIGPCWRSARTIARVPNCRPASASSSSRCGRAGSRKGAPAWRSRR